VAIFVKKQVQRYGTIARFVPRQPGVLGFVCKFIQMRMRLFPVLLVLLPLFAVSCGLGKYTYYDNRGVKKVDHYRRFLLNRSTSYTKWGTIVSYDSATGKRISKVHYTKKVSCFATHYTKYTTIRYDSTGKRTGKTYLIQKMQPSADTAQTK
jgi:hypothetical protein